MKMKKRFLLALILLFSLLMAVSAFAEPRLSTSTVTISPTGCVNYYNSPYTMGISYAYVPTSLYALDVNRNINITCDNVLHLKTHAFSVGGAMGLCKQGKMPVEVDFYCENGRTTYYRGPLGAGTYIHVSPYEPNKTYKIKVMFRKENRFGELICSQILKVKVKNDLAKTISYLQIGNKKYTTPFRSSKSNDIIDLKGVPTGKPVKITFKTAGKLKNAKYFYLLRTKKAYKNGSKVTLKKGDVLMIGNKLDKYGHAYGSVPIVINVNHNKYKES